MNDPPPTTIARAPARYHMRYGYVWCEECGFEAMYCRCDERSPDAPAEDGDLSSLAARIREVRRMMGGTHA